MAKNIRPANLFVLMILVAPSFIISCGKEKENPGNANAYFYDLSGNQTNLCSNYFVSDFNILLNKFSLITHETPLERIRSHREDWVKFGETYQNVQCKTPRINSKEEVIIDVNSEVQRSLDQIDALVSKLL